MMNIVEGEVGGGLLAYDDAGDVFFGAKNVQSTLLSQVLRLSETLQLHSRMRRLPTSDRALMSRHIRIR